MSAVHPSRSRLTTTMITHHPTGIMARWSPRPTTRTYRDAVPAVLLPTMLVSAAWASARVDPARLADRQPRVLQPVPRRMHGIMMVFGAIMPAFVIVAELDDSA